MRKLTLKIGLILLINASLVACGGGGGGVGATAGSSGSSTTTGSYSAISDGNYQTVAAAGLNPLDEMTNLNGVTGSLVSGVEVSAPSLNLASASTRIYKRFSAMNSRLVTGAVESQACSGGGSVTIDAMVASDGRHTVGDRVAISAKNCTESDLPAINGSVIFTVASVSGDPLNSDRYILVIAGTFDNFELIEGVKRTLISGDLTAAVSQDGSSDITVSLSGESLSLTVTESGTATDVYRLASYGFTGTVADGTISLSANYTLSGFSVKLGDYTYRVETVRPLVMSGGALPSSGSLVITGLPAKVTVTALDGTSLRVDYSANGDGIITASNTLSRSQLDALN
jgi:hypothetical protein